MDAEDQTSEMSDKLDSLDIEELKDLRKTVDRAISSYEGSEQELLEIVR